MDTNKKKAKIKGEATIEMGLEIKDVKALFIARGDNIDMDKLSLDELKAKIEETIDMFLYLMVDGLYIDGCNVEFRTTHVDLDKGFFEALNMPEGLTGVKVPGTEE